MVSAINYRAYLLDLWLFLRKIAPSALAIALTLLASTMGLYLAGAWDGASLMICLVRSVYMMTLESVDPISPWYLEFLVLVLPLLGIIFAAEGLVGATVLFLNRSQRVGEWNAVIASTYSGHVVVCGLGQLGGTLCLGLLESGRRVVAIEVDDDLPPVVTARRRDIPVIIGDMTMAEVLAEANVAKATCVVACSGDDLANIETAIMAREVNTTAAIYARVFKKSLADKINQALRYDITTFSPYATAAESILGQLREDV